MNTIEVMLKAIRQAITVMEIDTPNSDVLDLCYKSLSAGEDELRREPDGWLREDNSGNEGPSAVFEAPSKHMITCAAKCGEKYEPVWTREEIK